MENRAAIAILTFTLILSHTSQAQYVVKPSPLKPPPLAKTDDTQTDYFAMKVPDPYRWMEAGVKNPQFMDYLKVQSDYTRQILDLLGGRAKLLARIQELDNAVPRVFGWQRAGSSIFYLETDPGATTPSLMVRDATGTARKLLDPAQFEKNGKHAAIDFYTPSWDAKYVVAGVALAGSEDSVMHVVEVSSGKLLPDEISRTQYAGPGWRADSKSFHYSRLQKLPPDAPPSAIYENQRVYLHILGTDPEKDAVVFGPGVSASLDVPKAGFVGAGTLPDSEFAVAFYSAGTTDPPAIYVVPATAAINAETPWRKIVSAADHVATGADNSVTQHGSTLYLLLEKNAPNRKLVTMDLSHPDISQAQVVIPESDKVLTGVYAAQDGLYVSAKKGVEYELRRRPYDGNGPWQTLKLPYNGTISGIDANVLEPGVVFAVDSWTRSVQAFSFSPTAGQVTNNGLVPKDPADFSAVEAREVMARSTDGAMVPVSIICQKNLKLDGSHPARFEGYGSYGISYDPHFDPKFLAWVERGGVYAIAHVRGGGEFGESWHTAGQKETKQHTIDDMVATAQYLIENRYTSAERLSVRGTSAGGIAVGGAIVQHPELFAVAIDNVGDTDLLRFQDTQGGAANIPEFGDVKDPAGFKYLYAVSPYYHVKDGTKYPAVLGITGTNDPRVPSWAVAKMIARLQAASTSGHPILLRVDTDAGHGIGSTRPQRERQLADELSFTLWQMGDPEFQPK